MLAVLAAFLISFKNKGHVPLPTFIIPFIEAKLALFPVFFSILCLLLYKSKSHVFYLIASLVALGFVFKGFWGQTVFTHDYEARQGVIRDQELYPNPLLARTFHNKLRIYTDKVTSNSLAAADLNNYFFAFHPHQIVGNQNLVKFPFWAIIPFLLGIYFLKDFRHRTFIIVSFLSGLFSLSSLSIFDRNDFILYVPTALILVHGLLSLNPKKGWVKIIFFLFAVVSVFEIARLINT